PRKNLMRVMKAFSKFTGECVSGDPYQLVIVGSKDFAHGKFFQEMVKTQGETLGDVIFTGYVDQQDLNCLYACAEAFVFPSLYEGFGFPVIEAMASGTPVITSDRTSLPEVAGEAALKVNPEDTDAIFEGMRLFAMDNSARNEFIQKGFQRIKNFSWSKTARETLAVYEALC
ncbi:MAG TPA: glycosyltransferase family 1 protein, partial [bacterium]|nr:glycosyltransferase family 1 protein [bacterium]